MEPKRRILVVEDYEPLRYLKTHILERAGYGVIQAATASEALALIGSEKIGVVLLDLNLPDMPGIELCRMVKNNPATADVPIVYTSSESVAPGIGAGADGYVGSLEPEDLIASIEAVLHRRGGEFERPCEPLGSGPAKESARTKFAPAGRRSREEIERQAGAFAITGFAREILDHSPAPVAVLNPQRQIVFANKALTELLGPAGLTATLGLRPGEVLQCTHAAEGCGGCGTTEYCQNCGALRAMLDGLAGVHSVQECRITRSAGGKEEPLDLRVAVSPLSGQDGYVVCSITDISHEKRRRALEHIFFHDVLNAAGGVEGLANEVLELVSPGRAAEAASLLRQCARRIIEEIHSQRELLAAEDQDLKMNFAPVSTLLLVEWVAGQYRTHPAGKDRIICVARDAEDTVVTTDRILLSRVLANMLRNALEAVPPGEAVTIGCHALETEVEFWVRNPGVMPRETQLQVFQRSFSTKGRGRGLGTYSMKLLTERYLGGRVGFVSNQHEGTRFFARYPKTRS